MTKKQLEVRVTELEALVASLNSAIAALAVRPIYVGPVSTGGIPNLPYIGDPPSYPPSYPLWGPNTVGTVGGQGACGLTVFCKGAVADHE
jgi:hypothetical protein